MARLTIVSGDDSEVFELEDGEGISEVCEEAGVPFACTEGVCGTCVVEVLEGKENLSPFTEEERDFLGDDEGCERLACQCKIQKENVKITF